MHTNTLNTLAQHTAGKPDTPPVYLNSIQSMGYTEHSKVMLTTLMLAGMQAHGLCTFCAEHQSRHKPSTPRKMTISEAM